MSNKIKELAGHALDTVVPYTCSDLTYDELWALQEYFGKLIVRECCDLVNKYVQHNNPHDCPLVLDIKEHFGVE